MTTVQLRPDGTYLNQWSLIEQSTANAALADNADNSSVRGTFAGDQCRIAFNSFTLPAGAVVRTIAPIARVSTDASPGAYFQYQMTIANANTVGTSYTSPTITNVYGVSAPTNLTLTGLTGNYSQTDIDNLGFTASAGIITGTSHPFIHELYCNVLYVPPPTTVVTGPFGTQRVNNPTVTWQHQPGADAPGGQDAYRIVVYDYATGGAVYDTGTVVGAASSAVVGPLTLQHSYLAVVYTLQTTDGVQQWSGGGYTTFVLDVTGPTVVVTAPAAGAVVGTTSPLISWTHTPGAGAQTGQTFYAIIARDVLDPSTNLVDTGPVPSSASSARIGPLDPSISWVVWVATAQTTYGSLQWSPWASTTFTIDVVPALVASVVPTAYDPTGVINVLVERDTASPVWQTIDVEASYDGGTTWQAVRGATRLVVNGNSVTITDHEAPNDTPAQYRARATRVVSGEVVTGPWVVGSTSAQWHLEGNEVWLKDPAHPELSMRVCVSQLPDALYDRVVGVFRPIGAHYPVVVSDVLQAFSATAGVMTATVAEATAFLELVKAPVLLAQSPALPWGWGSRYVALGAVTSAHLGPTSPKGERLWSLSMFEVDRPADETAT